MISYFQHSLNFRKTWLFQLNLIYQSTLFFQKSYLQMFYLNLFPLWQILATQRIYFFLLFFNIMWEKIFLFFKDTFLVALMFLIIKITKTFSFKKPFYMSLHHYIFCVFPISYCVLSRCCTILIEMVNKYIV